MSDYLYITELAKELEELENELAAAEDEGVDADDIIDTDRLTAIRDLKAEMASTWDDILRYGGDGLIPEDEWVAYAQQLAEDIGAIDSNAQWPLSYIDWDAAAEALAQDYETATFEGTDYYYREP